MDILYGRILWIYYTDIFENWRRRDEHRSRCNTDQQPTMSSQDSAFKQFIFLRPFTLPDPLLRSQSWNLMILREIV